MFRSGLRIEEGNIWDFLLPPWNALVVVPTNIGWRKDGRNVMGRGLAFEASRRFRGIADWYGGVCKLFREETPVVRYYRASVLLAPSKPLASDPSLSWQQKADLDLVARSLRQVGQWHQLTDWQGWIAVPFLGCGNGGLDPGDVWPIMVSTLKDDRFVVIVKKGGIR